MEVQRQGDPLVSKIIPNQDEEFSKKKTNASLVRGLEVREEVYSRSSCLAKRKLEIILVIGLCTLFIVILLSTKTVAKSRSEPTLLQQIDCAGNKEVKAEFGRYTVFSGSFRNCDSSGFGEKKMRIIGRSDPLWENIQCRLGLQVSSCLALSPPIVVPKNTCKITLQTKAAALDDVFIISRDPFSYKALTPNAKADNQISFTNATLLSNGKTINLLIVPKQSATTFEEVKISVQRCYDYTRVEETSQTRGKTAAEFPRVLHHEYDRCSFEVYERGVVDCDWLKVTTKKDVSVGEFERVQSLGQNCYKTGVLSNPEGAKHFMKVGGRSAKKEEFTYAYLLSPILLADVSQEFTFSLHSDVTCNKQSELTAFVVGPNLDVLSVPEMSKPFLNVSTVVGDWMHHQKVVTIPKEYHEFQILLRAKVRNQGVCGSCDLTPHVVIDEIKIEATYPKCPTNTIGSSSFLNSDFQHGTYNNWTHETWELASRKRRRLPTVWRTKMLAGDHRNPLAIGDSQLKRDHYFRSPLVIARSNCSCVLKFAYTIYDEYESLVPLHVIQRYGVNSTKHVELPQQITLWHNVIPIPVSTPEWKNVQVPVKLVDNGVPFSFEFNTVSDPSQVFTRWMFFDDIKFEGCDLSLYTGER